MWVLQQQVACHCPDCEDLPAEKRLFSCPQVRPWAQPCSRLTWLVRARGAAALPVFTPCRQDARGARTALAGGH